MNEEDFSLLAVYSNFHGHCHTCGAELSADYLLVSPIARLSATESQYICLGIPNMNLPYFTGRRLQCPVCKNIHMFIRLTESPTNLEEWVSNIEQELDNEEGNVNG